MSSGSQVSAWELVPHLPLVRIVRVAEPEVVMVVVIVTVIVIVIVTGIGVGAVAAAVAEAEVGTGVAEGAAVIRQPISVVVTAEATVRARTGAQCIRAEAGALWRCVPKVGW